VAATPVRTATTDRPRWLLVAGLGLALFMATLDMTIVAVLDRQRWRNARRAGGPGRGTGGHDHRRGVLPGDHRPDSHADRARGRG
jgi:hypothetical protein